jgi:hypothetical protein
MENKQTAVEWLEEQFIWMIEDGVDWFDAFHSVMSKLEQAKQMEKEQTGDWVETHWYEEIDGKNYKLYYNKNNEWK